MTGSHHSTIYRSQSRQSDGASWCSRSSNRSRERFSRSRRSSIASSCSSLWINGGYGEAALSHQLARMSRTPSLRLRRPYASETWLLQASISRLTLDTTSEPDHWHEHHNTNTPFKTPKVPISDTSKQAKSHTRHNHSSSKAKEKKRSRSGTSFLPRSIPDYTATQEGHGLVRTPCHFGHLGYL